MKPLLHIDIVLSIYNQEKIIAMILEGIFKNTITPFTLILVYDGCTDATKSITQKYIEDHRPTNLEKFIETDTPNVYETKANNVGFRLSSADYAITLQDDMLIREPGWDVRLTYPLRKHNDILAVSSRIAQDIRIINANRQTYVHRSGRELATLARSTFAVRDIINRGPIAFRMNYFKRLEFFNESFAPSNLDDADLSLRAWKLYKWKVGAFWIDYVSDPAWSKTKAIDSTMGKMARGSVSKNAEQIATTHGNYILSGTKHDEDHTILDSEIDYPASFDRNNLRRLITASQRRYRLHVYPKLFYRTLKDLLRSWVYSFFELCGFKQVHELGLRQALKSRFQK